MAPFSPITLNGAQRYYVGMGTHTSVNVVIVDDSEIIRKQLRELLGDYPDIHVVADTDDIAEALVFAHTKNPDFFILDIRMPKGNGFALLKYLKNQNRAWKVIVLTNFADDCYRSKAEALGADYFFDKSTEFEKIIEVLRGTVATHMSSP
jgi:DNA-binding NarL/FixJ family response regulator